MLQLNFTKDKAPEYLEFLAKGKAADKGLILGDKSFFRATVDETTGFLTAPVKLARTGVQHYFGFELGLPDRALEKIGVFRSPDEVFHPDSIKSFVNLTVTDDHPDDAVTVDNVKDLQVGTVSHVEKDNEVLAGVVTITDKEEIKKIKDGKGEVSVGYAQKLIEQKGTFDGVEYEFAQTNIRANHLAIVDAGRCGSACKITIDKKEKPVKITIDGIEYDVENTQLAQAIQKQQSAHDAEVKGLKKKLDQEEEEKKEMEKEKDKAEAAKDALEKSTLDSDAINKLVADRAELIATAKEILGDKMKECTDCPKEIKSAVIDKVLGETDLSGKSDDYIDAMYDMAIKASKKASDSLKSLGDNFKKKKVTDGEGKEKTRESARGCYMKDTLKMEEV